MRNGVYAGKAFYVWHRAPDLYEKVVPMSEEININYTYIVECSDGTYYTGWTTDIRKRILIHNAKKGAKYTRARTPVKLVYLEQADTKQQAMRREAQIKKLSRYEKELLIKTRKDVYGNNKI